MISQLDTELSRTREAQGRWGEQPAPDANRAEHAKQIGGATAQLADARAPLTGISSLGTHLDGVPVCTASIGTECDQHQDTSW